VKLSWQGFPEMAGKLQVRITHGEKVVAALERPWQGKAGAIQLNSSPLPAPTAPTP